MRGRKSTKTFFKYKKILESLKISTKCKDCKSVFNLKHDTDNFCCASTECFSQSSSILETKPAQPQELLLSKLIPLTTIRRRKARIIKRKGRKKWT